MHEKHYDGFECHDLDGRHRFFTGQLPEELALDPERFETLWALHPEEYHIINMPGGPVQTPRWQQAYGTDYEYTGRVNRAMPMHPLLKPILAWAQVAIDGQLNGALVNWYDGELGHYIGKHRDSTRNVIAGTPIVTVSFGEERTFRLRPWKGSGCLDFQATDGTVFVEPYDTNLAWTHEVPRAARHRGRRISVTFRAFESTASAGTS